MTKKKEVTVEEKLRALYDLQLIDSRVDEIKSVRGELPLEIEDLEDEIVGLNKRLANFDDEVTSLKGDISAKKQVIEGAKEITRFTCCEKEITEISNNKNSTIISLKMGFICLYIKTSKRIHNNRSEIIFVIYKQEKHRIILLIPET